MDAGYHHRQRCSKGLETLSCGSVQVWGQSLYYQASGSGEDGPTILFLHEAGGSSATWHHQLVGLADHLHCLAPDLPGHGRSEGLGYAHVSDYRNVVLGFLDGLAIGWPVIMSGVGLGAAVALDLAAEEPDRVSGLILTGVCEGGRVGPVSASAPLVDAVADSTILGLFGRTRTESRQLAAEHLKRWRRSSLLTRHRDLSAVAEYPFRERLHQVTQPTLMIAGEEDPVAGPAAVRSLADGNPQVRVGILERTGCLGMIEDPPAFNRLLLNFLEKRLGTDPPIQGNDHHPGGYRRFTLHGFRP